MKYIAFYNDKNHLMENRYVNPAAATVIEYMMNIFSDFDDVEIISPSRTLNKKGVYKGRKTKLSSNITLKVPFTIGLKTRIGVFFVKAYTQLWLLWELLFNTHINETVVFYHSLSTMHIASLLMKLRKLNIIIEFREIYSDINSVKKCIKNKELSYWKDAKAMIVPSKSFEEVLDIKEKLCLYVPGTYKVHNNERHRFSDDKIHIVYAGNLRPEKGGAYIAVDCAKYLNSDYVIHILGKGSENEISKLQEKIISTTLLKKADVRYEGFKTGQELSDFIAMCNIGLAVQKEGDFANSSFPSKILLYLTNGVNVIAPRIDTVTMSPISDLVEYYDVANVENVAQSILNMEIYNPMQIFKTLEELDIRLKREWKKIINIKE